ncbi:MAG TPA: hypothetical protein VJB09_00435 [Candidatus Paceibacterota bacterium]
MQNSNHYIIFSHGFGVRKDSRGLFLDIASWLKDYTSVMFDYNEIREEENTIVVKILSEQSEKLSEVVNKIGRENPEATIDIITHSQGAIPAALAKIDIPVRKVVLLAPSINKDMSKMIKYFEQYPDTVINLEGESVLGRRDGSKTIVPKEFWQEKQKYDQVSLYNELSTRHETTIVFADQDEVVSSDVGALSKNMKVIHLNSDHNFTGEARNELQKTLLEIFAK